MSTDPLSKRPAAQVEVELDHVCGMHVPSTSAHRFEFMGRDYLFCSARCRERFETMPEAFVLDASPGASTQAATHSELAKSEVFWNHRVSLPRVCLYGFFLWALVLAAGMAMYRWRVHSRPLFESMIAVVLAAVTAGLATLYLERLEARWRRHAIAIGVVWPVLCVVLDAPLFGAGPMRMSVPDYLKDIGLAYLMIPIITSALAYQAAKQRLQH